MRHLVYLIAMLLTTAGCLPPYQTPTDDDDIDDAEVEGDEGGECDDGVDNDQDGLTDCADPGCLASDACTGDDDDDDDDDTTPGDDDTTPGDDDDDTTPGDDDDDTWPDSPTAYSVDVSLTATGGPAGGTATVDYQHVMLDQSYDELCDISFQFNATYAFGPNQGPEFWTFVNETVTWTAGGETANSCPGDWAIYEGDAVTWFEWFMHPMAFVSCELVGTVADLADTFLGEDDSGYLPTTDGTFADFCDNVGPSYETAAGTGPIEGVWLYPGMSGALDPLGDFGYFEATTPGDPSLYDSWMLMGLLMADGGNYNEPTTGLDGDYVAIPFWLWVYTG